MGKPAVKKRFLATRVTAAATTLALCVCALAADPSTQPVDQTTESPTTQAATTQPANPVAAIVAQLDDPDFGIRESAEAKLEQLGSTIEPALKAALGPNISDEARARINHLIHEFDEARAMYASITLHYTNAPAMKVLTDFATQAGAPMGTDDSSVAAFVQGRTVTINLDNAGFWDSLRAIDDATGLTPWVGPTGITFAGGSGRIISQIDLSKPWVRTAGGILIQYVSSNYSRNKNFIGNQPNISFVNVQLNAIPEPRMHVIAMAGGNWITQCIDEKGTSLVQDNLNRRMFIPRMMFMRGPRQWQFPLVTNFREIPNMGTHIAKLVGELNLSIETQGLTTKIDDITRAANTTKDDGQLSVTVLSCARTNMNYELILQIRGARMNDAVYQEFVNTLDLLDEKGQSIPRQTYVPRPLPDGIRLTIGFLPTQSTPTSLQWERTIEQKKLVVPFELDDLPPW